MIMAATSHPQALPSCQKGTTQKKSRVEKGEKNVMVRSVLLDLCHHMLLRRWSVHLLCV